MRWRSSPGTITRADGSLSLAAIPEGLRRDDAARIGGMDRQTRGHWGHLFNAGRPDALLDPWTSGPTPRFVFGTEGRTGGPRQCRPRQPADQREENAYLFGAICPARGTGAAITVAYAKAKLQLHSNEISRHVARGARA